MNTYCGKIILFSLLLSSVEVLSKKECRSQKDCNTKGDIVCSVCVDDISDKHKYCVYPFPYRFDEGTCIPRKTCQEDCNPNGRCVNVKDYPPYCRCKYSFHGAACQFKAAEEPAYEVQEVMFKFLTVVKQSEYTPLQIRVTYTNVPGVNISQNVVLVLNSDTKFYERFISNQATPSTRNCYSDKKICSFEYYKANRFPYIGIKNNYGKELLTNGDEILGYIGKFYIHIYIFGKESYVKELTRYVEYKSVFLNCMPLIDLSNCSPSGMSPSIISRSSLLVVQSSVLYLKNGGSVSSNIDPTCANNANYKWMTLIYNEVGRGEVIKELYEKKFLSFDPYSLDFALYKVILDIKVVLDAGTSHNNAYCYFRVTSLPLEALIDGGSDRKVFKKYGLRLSAKRSRDPNTAPSQQDHVFLQWSCVREDDPHAQDDICKPMRFKVSEVYNIPPEQLTYGAVYKFKLIVGVEPKDRYKYCVDCDIGPKYAYIRVEVGAENETTTNLVIKCVLNCGSLVSANRKIFLRAQDEYKPQESSDTYKFKWVYFKSGEEEKPFDNNTIVDGLPSYMLLVNEGTFQEGFSYTVVVRVEMVGTEMNAKYTFETGKMIYEHKCEPQPISGVKKETKFTINCSLPQDATYTFEFYDKTADEDSSIFNGRMLGTTHSGQLQNVRLTRGTVCVYIMNNNGLHKEQTIRVELTDLNVTDVEISKINNELSDKINQGDISILLRYISCISDITPVKYKKEMFNTLINTITNIPLRNLGDVKLCASTLSNVLQTLNIPNKLAMTADQMTHILQLIEDMAKMMNDLVKHREQSQYMNPEELGQVAKALLDCLHATFECRDPAIEATDVDDLQLRVLYTLKDGATATENTLDQVKDILTYLQAPGQPPTKLTSKNNAFVVWAMKHDDGFTLGELLKMDTIPVTIPALLLRRLNTEIRDQDELALQVATINYNVFWWRRSDIKSSLSSISLVKQVKENRLMKIDFVNPPVEMSFEMPPDLKSTHIKGIVDQPDPKSDPIFLDLAVKVHRLDLAPGSFLSIKFLFPQTTHNLQVLLMEDFRPDYDMIKNSFQTVLITKDKPVYPYNHRHRDEPTFFFLGILPGPEVQTNQDVSYEFELNTTVCQFWASDQWSSSGCEIGKDTAGIVIRCQCSHLSIFAAAFPVPPQEIDPFADAKLFLTVIDNPVVVAVISSMLLFYILICIFIWYQDKADKYKKTVIVLEDNFPNDTHPYLIAVYTSSRFNAGTSANVGLKIFGAASTSRAHVLSSKYRKVLRRNTDDWFLLFCPDALGKVLSLHIWHDNAGSNPDWFCEKIFIYDLEGNEEILFVVEQWLALRLNSYPEANLVPASSFDVLSVKRMFLENCVLGLMEGHILLSILLTHPRSEVSRLQRVSVFLACLLVAMLCSIMFYKPSSAESAGVDDFHYSIGSRELIVSLESLIISGVVVFIVLFFFQKAHTQKLGVKDATVHRTKEYSSSSNVLINNSTPRSQHRQRRTLYRYFVESVTKIIKAQPFAPMQMPNTEPLVRVRKFWFLIAWTICLAVIAVCSYLVMLYGLKLGKVNSEKWLTSVALTMVENIFFAGPIKIIFFAMIMSFAFQRMFVVNTHRVGLGDAMSVIPLDSEEYIKKWVARRQHPMYAPLSSAIRKEILRQRELWKKWWTFIDFTISIGFVVIVGAVIFWLWSSHYYNNNHIKDIITSTRVPFLKSVDFFKVKTIPQMNYYLQNSLSLALFKITWYNSSKIGNNEHFRIKYWAADYANKMIGLPMVRQLRVTAESCENIVLTKGKCLPPWRYSNEDTDVYGPRWSAASWRDVSKNISAWKYTTRRSIPAMMIIFNRLYGASGRLYDTGGYLVTLGPRRDNAEETLTELRMNDWQDPRTRVLFVELTLYNPNEGLFSQATLVAEYLVSGTVLLKAQVDALYVSLNLGIWSLVFVGFIVWYTFRSGYLINKSGLLEYLASVNNVFRLVVVALGYLAIATCFTHFQYSAQYYNQFQDSGMNSYFDFDAYSYYFVLTKVTLSVLISLAFLRTILFIRLGRSLITHYYTLLISFSWLFWLTLIAVLLIFILRQLTYLLNIFQLTRVNELVINKNSMDLLTSADFYKPEVQVFLYLKMVLVSIITSLCIILFMYFSKLARNYKLNESDKFNYFTFLAERLSTRKTKKNSI